MKRKILAVFLLLFSTLLGGFVGATKVASLYSYHPQLGSPLIELFGWKLYPFWALFSWQYSLPEEVIRSGLLWCMGGASVGALMAFALLIGTVKKFATNIFGDAAWAKLDDITELKLLAGRGFFLGKLKDGRYLRYEGPHHASVIAPTRSGKGAGIVIPALCTHRGSAIVYDIKEENFQRTAHCRSAFSDIIYFNPCSVESAHFNPLFSIRKGIHEVKDAQNLANIIVEPDRPGQIDHWVRTGNSLLTAAILHVLYAGDPAEKNLAGVANLLSRPEMGLVETLQEMLETKHIKDAFGNPLHPHPSIVAAVRDVLNKSSDDRSSVVSTVMGYLSIYRDPLLANCTRDSDFTVEDLMLASRPKTLYLVVSANDIDRVKPVTRILLNLICRRLCEPVEQDSIEKRHKLLLALDEFPTLGRMEFFETALAYIAGFGMRALLVSQSLNQLKLAYGERSSILDNTHVRVFYTPNTIETAEYISRTLGDSTISYKTGSESGQIGSPFFTGKSESVHITRRPLLTPREVMELPSDEAIVFVGGAKPIRCYQSAYYKDEKFLALTHSKLEIKRLNQKPFMSEWEQLDPDTPLNTASQGLTIEQSTYDPLDTISPSEDSDEFDSEDLYPVALTDDQEEDLDDVV
jgi:type IV secretion system protein VirD4